MLDPMWTRHCGFLFARDLPGWVANCPRLESSVVNIHDCLRQIELVLACYKLIVPTLSSQRAGTCWAKCALVVEACQRRGGEGGRGQQQGGGACRQDIEQACCGGGGATFQVWVRLSSNQDFEMTPLVTKRFLLRAWSVSQVNSPVLGLVRTAQTLTMPDHRKPASHAGSQRFSPTLHISPMQTPSFTMFLVGTAWLVDWGGLKKSEWDQSCFKISLVLRSVLF